MRFFKRLLEFVTPTKEAVAPECQHSFSKWEDSTRVDVFNPYVSDKMPVRSELVQIRECQACGLKQARRIRL